MTTCLPVSSKMVVFDHVMKEEEKEEEEEYC